MKSADANKLVIIGAGNMGQACAETLTACDEFKNFEIFFLSQKPITNLAEKLAHIKVTSSLAVGTKVIIVAVKPKDFMGLQAYDLQTCTESPLIVSMMAGVRLDTLAHVFSKHMIVRFMSNLGIRSGKGVACFYHKQSYDHDHNEILDNLCKAFGMCLKVDSEDQLDTATALIGSFPALLIQVLQEAMEFATQAGFNEKDILPLIKQVALSTCCQLANSNGDLQAEIAKIASKGGTTEAMLNHMKSELGETLQAALLKAEQKSQELAQLA